MLVLDTGALIAAENGHRYVVSRLRLAFKNNEPVHVPVGVIAQVWRRPDRQVNLVRTLKRCQAIPLDEKSARSCGSSSNKLKQKT